MRVPNPFSICASSISVGLDLGTYSVKIAQIKKKSLSNTRHLSFGISEIKPQRSARDIVEAIKRAASLARLESKRINLSVYGPDVIMRYIVMPVMKERELRSSLEIELERYIPGKSSEMAIQHRILYTLPNKQMLVLLIAVKKKIIEERVFLVKEAGFTPVSVSVDALALIEAFRASRSSGLNRGVIALLDVGHNISKLTVCQDDLPYFSRDITTGISDFIQLICDKMNIEDPQARNMLDSIEQGKGDLYEAIKPSLNVLLDELRLSIEYCSRNLSKRVSHLFISGGGSKFKALQDILSSQLSLKTSLLDVTNGYKYPRSVPRGDIKSIGPLLTVAVGLAIG